MLRDARAVNDKVRLFAKLGAALIEAKDGRRRPRRRGRDRRRLGAARGERRRSRTPGPSGQGGPPGAWPPAPGRCCTGSGRCSSALSSFAPCRPRHGTLRAVELLRDAYASGGRKWPRSLPTSFLRPAWRDAVLDAAARATGTAASGRRRPCSRCATGCAPATSGSRAAGNGAPSRISSSRPRCSPPCARPGRCRSPCPRPRRNIWPSAAPCWTGGWRRSPPRPRRTRWKTSGSRATS